MSDAVVLLSGGLDSTVCLALAVREAAVATAVTFDYGQRHQVELGRAAAVAAAIGVEHVVVRLDLTGWGGSALTDPAIAVPDAGAEGPPIPATYVPARNLIFCSVASGVAEAKGADWVYLGINAVDYSGYPDCRPEFLLALQEAARLGLKRGVEGRPLEFRAPLVQMTKAEIVQLGVDLDAPLHLTWSCYQGEPRGASWGAPPRDGPRPCGSCDACTLRAKGFAEAGLVDPSLR